MTPEVRADKVERRLFQLVGEWQRRFDSVLGPELLKRREEQDAQWGGPAHDDTHGPWDWFHFIRKQVDAAERSAYLARATFNAEPDRIPDAIEDRLKDVAALAIAAIQSSRRQRLIRPHADVPKRT